MQTTVRRAAPAWLTAVSVLMLVALLVGGRLAEWTFALCAALFPVLLIALGTRRASYRLPVVGLPLLGFVLVLSAAAVLWLSSGDGEPVLAGLPSAALWMLGGLGLVPLVLVIWIYTRTFDPDEDGDTWLGR